MSSFEHPSSGEFSHTSEQVAYTKEELDDAQRWVSEAQKSLWIRISQYLELGNVQAAEDLQALHQATLEMIAAHIQEGNPPFVKLLSRLEDDALTASRVESASYLIAHGIQLDAFATRVRQAQEYAQVNDPYSWGVC